MSKIKLLSIFQLATLLATVSITA